MHSLLHSVCIRSLYASPLLVGALLVSAQAAGPVPGSGMANRGMSRPQRTMTMPAFSPNASTNLGSMPFFSTYGMGRAQQTGGGNAYGSGSAYGGPGGYGMSEGYVPQGENAAAGGGRYTSESQPSPE